METNQRRLALAFALSTFAACGGGSGGGSSTEAPSNLDYADGFVLELSGVDFAPRAPTFDGAVESFEVEPTLPVGLTLDTLTGVLDGFPSAPAPRRSYTITARNAGGFVATEMIIEIAGPQRFVLVSSATDGSIATMPVDALGNHLMRGPLAFPTLGNAGSEGAVAHPNGRFVYVTYSDSNTLGTWRFDEATGRAESIGSSPLDAGSHAAAIAPSGDWLLVTCRLADVLRVYALDPLTGAATLSHVTPLGKEPSDLAFSPDGERVYVTHAGVESNGLGSSLACYSFLAGSGSVQLVGAPLALNGGRPVALAVDPRGSHVYLTLSMFDAVLAVRVGASGLLSPIAPLHPAGDDPVDIEVDARGRFVYVAAATDDAIRAFELDPVTNALRENGSFEAGESPRNLRRDALGGRLFAVAQGSAELLTYTITASGTLEQESSMALRPGASHLAFVTGARPLAFAPRFVHAANEGSDDVHAFRVDVVTGALTFTGQAFTDDAPTSLAMDAQSRFALVVATGARTVQRFTVSAVDGTLLAAGPSLLLPGTPVHVTIEPSGRFAYVATRDVSAVGDGRILTLALAAGPDELTLVDQRSAGASSCHVAVAPTGEFVYVANAGDGTAGSATIATFRMNPSSGIPTQVGSPVFAAGVAGLAFHPDGRSVYAVLRGADALARYAIDGSSGSLTLSPPSAGTGFEPSSLAVDHRGRFVWAAYMGNASAGEINVLPVLADTALGDPIQQIVDGNDPIALSIEPSGRFLYAANRTSHDISVLAIDPANGLLQARTPALAGTAPSAIVATGTMQ